MPTTIQLIVEGNKVGKKAAKALTAKQVQTETRAGYHADGLSSGLNLQVTPVRERITRSWVFRYTMVFPQFTRHFS